jgi:hypothetical protein
MSDSHEEVIPFFCVCIVLLCSYALMCYIEQVQDALKVLALRIRKSSNEMNGQNLANAFYSLHGMSNQKRLLKKQRRNNSLKGHDAHTLSVLIQEKAEVPAVTEVLSALAEKLVSSQCEFSSLDVAMSL